MATQIPKIQIGNLVRDMTAEEIEQLEIDKAAHQAWLEIQSARQTLKAATLVKLGITADEVAALLS